MKTLSIKHFALSIIMVFLGIEIYAQTTPLAQMEKLDRGVVAVPSGSKTFVSWRLLGTDAENTTFDLMRNGKLVVTGLEVTNYTDGSYASGDEYQVITKHDGEPIDTSAAAVRWSDVYMTIKMDRPASQPGYNYFPNDCSVGDADGDGQYEVFVKWDPSNTEDNSIDKRTGKVYLDCYKLSGEKLWRVDLGVNIRAGAHYTQFLVYDFDGDGRCELICKTGPGTIDGKGDYASDAADDEGIRATDNSKNYVNSKGHVMTGPEFLTVFSGLTGEALHTVWYNPNRGFGVGTSASYSSSWGDSSGNRGERYLACVAYLDGAEANPSAVMCRGYYTRSYLWAVDFDGSRLKTKWLHGSTSFQTVKLTDAQGTTQTKTYNSNTSGMTKMYTAYGQGNHNISVADVDGDGCDEILYGSATIDNNGWLLYTTGLGHGDALHLSDLMPDREGLELFDIHEDSPYGFDVHDAATGEILIHKIGKEDTGRGMAADINSTERGFEFWSSAANDVFDIYGTSITTNRPSYCFRMYWDGDAYDDLLDGASVNDGKGNRLMTFYQHGNSTVYGSKANPNLSADIFGDWREEVVFFDKNDSSMLNIFTTTTATKFAVPTLMHDHVYRMGIAWQNVAYNQPAHLGYYLPDYVASAFVPIGESVKDQEVALGDSMKAVVCRLKNCTGALLTRVLFNGEVIKSYAVPEGFGFAIDRQFKTITLSGKPSSLGIYEFVVKTSGDYTGQSVSDTIRVRVKETSGIRDVELETDNKTFGTDDAIYTISGSKVPASSAGLLPKGIYIVRGKKVVVR